MVARLLRDMAAMGAPPRVDVLQCVKKTHKNRERGNFEISIRAFCLFVFVLCLFCVCFVFVLFFHLLLQALHCWRLLQSNIVVTDVDILTNA